MQNYYPGLVWKIDLTLLVFLFLLSLAIIIYLFAQEFLAKSRKHKLRAIKNNIYELLLSKADRNTCPKDTLKITSKEFLDILTNRSRQVAFFNQDEQEFIRHCFINQNNIVKIERIARNTRNKWRRIEAMLALSFTEGPCALALFEKGLFDKDADVSYFSLLALGRIKTELSLKILLAFLRKDSRRRQKVAAILETFPESYATQIGKLIFDDDPEIRFWGLKLLLHFKPVTYLEKIIALSLDKHSNVRAAACACLGNIAGKEAEEVLLRSLKDGSWIVRVYAVNALSNAMGKESLKYITGLLSDNSLNVIEAVKDVLMRNVDTALPYLEKVLVSGEDTLAKRIAVEILATSGYIEQVIRNAALKEIRLDPQGMNLLAALVNSGAHYSIEAALLILNSQEQQNALVKLSEINKAIAEHLKQKIKGTIKEI